MIVYQEIRRVQCIYNETVNLVEILGAAGSTFYLDQPEAGLAVEH